MKNKIVFTLGLLVLTSTTYSQGRPPTDPALAELLNQKDSVLLEKKLIDLGKSEKEADVTLLSSYYNNKRQQKKVDSVNAIIKKRFPNGTAAFNVALTEIYNERDPGENEKKYKSFMSRFSKNPSFTGHRYFDFVKYYVAVTFLGKNNPKKVLEYLNAIKDTVYKTNAFSYAAREAISVKEFELGEKLIRKTFNDIAERPQAKSSQSYGEYLRLFSILLFENKKYDEGFNYAKEYYELNKNSKSQLTVKGAKSIYLNYLVATNQLAEAFPMMEESIRDGTASPIVKSQFKSAYSAAKGSTVGFEEYAAPVYAALKEKIKEDLLKKMISEPASDFTLRDINGKTVSLASLKGKVIVLDFWATWCAPCKASFPDMQLVVDKFRNDENVVFLFIHTFEQSANPLKDAASYIQDKKFTFQVLMDMKDAETKSNVVATAYKVQGLPTKMVIDKNGNIRFKSLGNAIGLGDAFVQEVISMVELAQQG